MDSSIGNLFASVTAAYNRAITAEASKDESSPDEQGTEWWILGEYYDRSRARERREKEISIMWWSYRSNFLEMRPYGFTSVSARGRRGGGGERKGRGGRRPFTDRRKCLVLSPLTVLARRLRSSPSQDTGWGCMLRCSQMLLCQSLSLHRPSITPETYLSLFADVPGKAHPFGIHGMCRAGLGRDKFPGEWFGPREGCFVVKDLVGESKMGGGLDLKIIVAGEGCIYRDNVVEEMEKEEMGEEVRRRVRRRAKRGAVRVWLLNDSPLPYPPPIPPSPCPLHHPYRQTTTPSSTLPLPSLVRRNGRSHSLF